MRHDDTVIDDMEAEHQVLQTLLSFVLAVEQIISALIVLGILNLILTAVTRAGH